MVRKDRMTSITPEPVVQQEGGHRNDNRVNEIESGTESDDCKEPAVGPGRCDC